MDQRTMGMLRAALLGSLIATLPAVGQNGQPQQTRPAPGGRPGGGGPPNQGGQRPPNQGRPGGPPNNGGGGPQIQPHPNPGPKPQPGQPNRPPNRPPNQGRPPNNGGRPQPGPKPQPRPPQHRPPQWGRPPAHRPSYGFRPGDRDSLRRYYASRFGYINRARRPIFSIGGFLPFADLAYLSPLPVSLYGALPPIPPGCQVGYWDGYVIVYDPMTGYIVSVVDLL